MAVAVLALCAVLLWAMPIQRCEQCPHCRLADQEKVSAVKRLEREERQANHAGWHRAKGSADCPYCEEDRRDG